MDSLLTDKRGGRVSPATLSPSCGPWTSAGIPFASANYRLSPGRSTYRTQGVVLATIASSPDNCALGATTLKPHAEHPGGCYTCRYFGERRDPAVWCAYPGGEHVRSQAERGCSFWEREPGADCGSCRAHRESRHRTWDGPVYLAKLAAHPIVTSYRAWFTVRTRNRERLVCR
jgi:hypothetical protein